MNTREIDKEKVIKAMDNLADEKIKTEIEIREIDETLSDQLALSFMGNLEARKRVSILKSKRAKLQEFLSYYELTRKGLGALLP